MGLAKLSILFIIFSFYLTLDIYLIVEEKYGTKCGVNGEIFAAVKLYIDVIGVFVLALLSMMN